LLIETLDHPNVYFAVRGSPVLNDVTINDAVSVNMMEVVEVISNGSDAPSTLINRTSVVKPLEAQALEN